MTPASAMVLKFGGSVLKSAASMPAIVDEILRWRAAGVAVVAVVSALAGRTDALLAECRALGELAPDLVAARTALGEREAAAMLGVALGRRGIGAVVLDPAALQLRARGAPLDADPVSLDVATLRVALVRHGVVVVPGFVAVDGEGRTVLLGRGGSDLTALFLAERLQCRCRLVKDVAGLFDRDPAATASGAPRAAASHDDVARLGGRLVQQKALQFARRHGLAFELSALGRDDATRIEPANGSEADCG